jgi:hypothetical protein
MIGNAIKVAKIATSHEAEEFEAPSEVQKLSRKRAALLASPQSN